jgi:hypothetical protein
MSLMTALKKAFMNNWTGGASIDPRTGQRGDPGRYHGRGTFDDFELRDMLRQNRWITEEKVGRNPRSDGPEYTSYYHPRLTGENLRSFMEDANPDNADFSVNTSPYSSGPPVTDPGLQRRFQDWRGRNFNDREYDINPNPELGRNPDNPAHRYHPWSPGSYNHGAAQAAYANRVPPDRMAYERNRNEERLRGRRFSGAEGGYPGQQDIGILPDNTTRTIVQSKDGTKETVVTKSPNPETSMMEIMERLRELQEARAR